MDFLFVGRHITPPPPLNELQKPAASTAEQTLLPAPLSVEEARAAAKAAHEPREKTAIIRALLSQPPASTAALSLATEIANQSSQASLGYASARETLAQPEKQ